jgi:hypothetical protein
MNETEPAVEDVEIKVVGKSGQGSASPENSCGSNGGPTGRSC